MTSATLPPTFDERDLMTAALFQLRDVVDRWPDMPKRLRDDAAVATAAYLNDLRAAGVLR